jgi:hypothetical protein
VSRQAALRLCVPLSLLSGAVAGVAHLGMVAVGWAYNLMAGPRTAPEPAGAPPTLNCCLLRA